MCAYIYCSYKSARADKPVISFLARSLQQAMAVCACVFVLGWRLRLSGLTDVSRSNRVSAFRLKRTLAVFSSSRGAGDQSSVDVWVQCGPQCDVSWCRLGQICEPTANEWHVTYGIRCFYKCLNKWEKRSDYQHCTHAAAHLFRASLSISHHSDRSLLKPPTSRVTRFNHSFTPPSAVTNTKCQTHHSSPTTTNLVLTADGNLPFCRCCSNFLSHNNTSTFLWNTVFAVIIHRYALYPIVIVQLYF